MSTEKFDDDEFDGLEEGREEDVPTQPEPRALPPRQKIKIIHEELGLESEVLAVSLPAWELSGWTLVDDYK